MGSDNSKPQNSGPSAQDIRDKHYHEDGVDPKGNAPKEESDEA